MSKKLGFNKSISVGILCILLGILGLFVLKISKNPSLFAQFMDNPWETRHNSHGAFAGILLRAWPKVQQAFPRRAMRRPRQSARRKACARRFSPPCPDSRPIPAK